MPFALIFVGLILLIAAIRGKQKELFALLREDFTGDANFIYWIVAVVFIVAVGTIEKLRPVSNAFLWLVILVIILGNGRKGLFDNFMVQVKRGTSGSTESDIGFSNLKSTVNKIRKGIQL